jgi:hypothetical protein
MTVHQTFIGKIIRKQDCASGIEGVSYLCRNCVHHTDPYFTPCNQVDGGTDASIVPSPILLCKLHEGHTGKHEFI